MKESAPVQLLHDPLFATKGVQVYLKREDLLHPTISGNKWRKLKYNLQAAREQKKDTLVTFGGAYSNHIAAVAAAGKEYNFRTVGYIRGEAHQALNPTLTFAISCGMQLHYLDRETYRLKNTANFLEELQHKYPSAYLLPEGGTNLLALKGCTEILQDIAVDYDYIICAAGTGGTLAGLIAGLAGEKEIIGFPALKGGAFLQEDISQLIFSYGGQHYHNWELQTQYHFGGYAKIKPELISFIQYFKQQHQVQLEPIYTGKMLYGLYDLIRQEYFKPGTAILAIHTGGLQGLAGLEERLGLRLT
ncbi:1-aminocyclopropane-1-carboxylate deaminase/D-cysteine desulfhydrase [Adhaeribacter rhizoryzae]|uniref:1-aminocyclopropane-1-carboxylate deaminase/D-cysteine desulfhydrase n=1 Tax=Adhaeribacter rhizoryzae TaxID=2607907 RepID=A0A5M6D8T0_9BACT|nr:pyridoxal-phosphate dependent enzyme [Adhaeribacter rhizoryzae]KAA5543948.1 1-aminocyclopropane-1-carboxylate deaminase/D-cysteine desulfhydrase [Adhaeribacter rhizoryzae]